MLILSFFISSINFHKINILLYKNDDLISIKFSMLKKSERVVFFAYSCYKETSLIKYIFHDLEIPYYVHFILDYQNKDYYKGIGVQNKFADVVELTEWIKFKEYLLRFLKMKNIEIYVNDLNVDIELVEPNNNYK